MKMFKIYSTFLILIVSYKNPHVSKTVKMLFLPFYYTFGLIQGIKIKYERSSYQVE